MKKIVLVLSLLTVIIFACKKDPAEEHATFDPTLYQINFREFPDPEFPLANKPTNAGVMLGRMLFYEKAMSKDGSQACADCHRQQHAFSDSLQFSIGVEKLPGKRQAMAVMNLAWHKNGMFWDGRAASVHEQALKPIQDPLEMNEKLDNVVAKLQADKKYRDQFVRAFGSETVTAEKIGLAIEQFEWVMISNNSKFDQYKRGEVALTDSEERGRKLFFTEFDPSGQKKGAECFHCHGGFNFTNDDYMNNGLDAEASQTDIGKQKVSNDPADKAKFKTPSLRNVALTAPYMHNGRFQTLEQVIDHYNTGVKNSPTVDFLMQYNLQPGGLALSSQDKADLIAFLKTLTDKDFLINPAFSNPF
ncbi:MAG: c-type cytochrome [Saprospiraceae bacterium]|nr:c-type cytochrome [Saprospiraceae bacterium]